MNVLYFISIMRINISMECFVELIALIYGEPDEAPLIGHEGRGKVVYPTFAHLYMYVCDVYKFKVFAI